MDVYEAIKTRRSVRHYSDREIPEEVLHRALDAARLAPSARNRQPWRFVVVKSKEKREAIAECCWLPETPQPQRWIARAPVVIVCALERYTSKSSWIKEMLPVVDLSIALDHLTLAARAEGLGTCWIAGGIKDGAETPEGLKENHQRLRQIVKAPENVDVAFVTPLGYPREGKPGFAETAEERRKKYEEVVFNESF